MKYLLPRSYGVIEGAIRIDGINIPPSDTGIVATSDLDCAAYVFLFVGTIRENISYVKLGARGEELWEAARRARFDGFIREQEQGMDTVIGERGMKLSGEQN
jgi:ATP-binding cassette subfamily B protein